MKKLVRESLNEGLESGTYIPDSEEDQKYLDETIQQIENFSSIDELDKYVFEMTCGHHFPFNPPEPLRTIFRLKLQNIELADISDKEKSKISQLSEMVKGEWKEHKLPDGAMY